MEKIKELNGEREIHIACQNFDDGYEYRTKEILKFIEAVRGDKSFTNPEMDKLKEMIDTTSYHSKSSRKEVRV